MKTDRAQYFVQEGTVYTHALLSQIQVAMTRVDKQTNARMVQWQWGNDFPIISYLISATTTEHLLRF